MILSDLKHYLMEHRRVTLMDLAHRFDLDPGAVRGMLGKWIAKGKLRKIAVDSACGSGCCKCDPMLAELYEWVE